ncbi:hypothetical protein D5086_022045 [Populus alba]|uniref:Uncharacterized protein n=1 Tax=Populus alba TaxID=43335 RepID=A0ACC4BDV8_POPAL
MNNGIPSLSTSKTSSTSNPALKPAKSNFNMLQKLWWKELDFTTKLPFARDRLIIVVLGLFSEPQYALARQILTKSTMLVSVLDDINDVHGTIEELEQFTKMIERWDTSMEDLPDYTKVWFEALFVSSSEIEEETTKEGRSYCVSYAKEAVNLILLLTQSARCFNEDHVPTLEENRKNGVFSCTYPLLTGSSLCGMGKIASKDRLVAGIYSGSLCISLF